MSVMIRAVLIGMGVMLAASLPRDLLFWANLHFDASVPWSVPLIAVYLWFFWRYLRGAGQPASTSVRALCCTELMNGVTAWRRPPFLYEPPCITVATDGSICSSFVLESRFYAFYKVALLRPKAEIPTDALYYVAYLLGRERWRYAYARKFGNTRINQTTLYAPARAGRPDFEKMARIVRATAAYPIVESFRHALAIRLKATHAV